MNKNVYPVGMPFSVPFTPKKYDVLLTHEGIVCYLILSSGYATTVCSSTSV